MIQRAVLATTLALSLLSLAVAETVEEKYPSGKVKLKYQTDATGKKSGYYVEYHENGRLKVRAACKADGFEGIHTTFYPSGTTHITSTYKQGKRNGLYVELDPKGKKKFSAVFRDDKLHGALKHYDKGKEIFTHAFKDGEPVFARSLEQTRKVLENLAAVPESEKQADPATAERLGALRRLKAYRFLAGVPYDNIELDSEFNRYCEAGAKLCAKIGRLDHTPANPGLPEDVYRTGYKGTSHSNLHVGVSKGKADGLSRSVDSYMDDSDPSNINVVGHRRWCINPGMLKTGFGRSGTFSAMWSMDESQPRVPDYEFISYPANGYMPLEFIGQKHAWNISLHPKKFLPPDDSIKPKIYEVDQYLYNVGDPLPLNHNTVSKVGAGIPYCLIFRPENPKLEDGQRYLIEVDGLRNILGQPLTLRFLVVFVDLNAKGGG